MSNEKIYLHMNNNANTRVVIRANARHTGLCVGRASIGASPDGNSSFHTIFNSHLGLRLEMVKFV